MTVLAVELRQVLELKVGNTILFGMYSSFSTGDYCLGMSYTNNQCLTMHNLLEL